MANELTTRNDDLPDFLRTAETGSGMDGVDSDCVSIPFLKLAQKMTGEVDPGPDHVEGLMPGMFFNSALKISYGERMRVIPVGFMRTMNEWDGKGKDAKFVASYSHTEYKQSIENLMTEIPNPEDPKEKIMVRSDNGHRVVDTRNVFLLNVDRLRDGIMMYAMTSTAIPASRDWMTSAKQRKHIYDRVWELSSTLTPFKKGSSYKLNPPSDCGYITAEMYPIVLAAFDEVEGYKASGTTIKAASDEDEKTPF